MTGYRIKFAPDDLMGGRDWLLCNKHGGGVTLYIRQGARRLPDGEMEEILASAWSGYRELIDVEPMCRELVAAY